MNIGDSIEQHQNWHHEARDRTTPNLLPIGVVRYSATRRRASEAGYDQCPVNVRVTDFIARKTAVFGMTRAGKSNTNKTIATAVFEHAARTGRKIGQLIFDPQGEYARVNKQDKTGQRLLGTGTDRVKIYTMRPDPAEPQEQPLALNFYDTRQLPLIWDLVVDSLREQNTAYANAFKTARIHRPDRGDFPAGPPGDGEYQQAVSDSQRAQLAFYATLNKAGFAPGTGVGFRLTFKMAKGMREALLNDIANVLRLANPSTGMCEVTSPAQARHIVKWIADRIAEDLAGTLDPTRYGQVDLSSWKNSAAFTGIREVFDETKGTVVINLIRRLEEFHDPSAAGDLAELVWQDMIDGRLIIVDLSTGTTEVVKMLSERLVFRLLDKANNRFRNNQDPVSFQIMVEEAHNLFDRTKSGKSTTADDPWVKLAKEAAKFDIGLIYATQEVSSVDQRILSNTSNWLVAHLNSDNETRELSHYYDFSTFASEIRSAEDRGYVRMKTFSSKYIVPAQIAKFDHEMINRAREAAGLAPIGSDGQPVPAAGTP